MRKNISYSLIVHALVLALGYFGLPSMRPDIAPVDVPITVEIVTVADKTNAPKPAPKPEAKKTKPEPKQKSKPEKKKAAVPPPPPPPPAKPEPEIAAVPPPHQPQPKAKLKNKPEAKKKPPPRLAKAKPRHKPRPPDTFASVLKTVEKLKKRRQAEKKEKKKKKKKEGSFEEMITKALISSKRQGDLSEPITISEIDLVRQQIARCWNLPAGAKDAENLIIEIKVFMNPDGTVNTADIKDKKRMGLDGFYRSAAESALRAVLNRRCQPFKLPPKKYNRWKTMTLVFNPKEMF